MNYVEWVEKVALAFAHLEKQHAQTTLGALRAELGVDPPPGEDERYVEGAVWTAIEDLDAITVVNALSHLQILESENTRRVRAGAVMSTLWPSFFTAFLEPEQREFLRALVEIAEDQHDLIADVHWATATEVFEALGWSTSERADTSRAHAIVNILDDAGMIKKRVAMGSIGAVRARPTYRGVVFATQQIATEWQQRLAEMAHEWETTTVEHKREVKLDNATQKSEFVKDVLGLATTKASGRERYLVIGYDNDSHAFEHPVDIGITQDRIEQILHQYIEPMPEVRYFTVPMRGGGEAGVIEVQRDPTKILYRVRRKIGKLDTGDIFVRHGSQTEPPTEAELEALLAEGEREQASRRVRCRCPRKPGGAAVLVDVLGRSRRREWQVVALGSLAIQPRARRGGRHRAPTGAPSRRVTEAMRTGSVGVPSSHAQLAWPCRRGDRLGVAGARDNLFSRSRLLRTAAHV